MAEAAPTALVSAVSRMEYLNGAMDYLKGVQGHLQARWMVTTREELLSVACVALCTTAFAVRSKIASPSAAGRT